MCINSTKVKEWNTIHSGRCTPKSRLFSLRSSLMFILTGSCVWLGGQHWIAPHHQHVQDEPAPLDSAQNCASPDGRISRTVVDDLVNRIQSLEQLEKSTTSALQSELQTIQQNISWLGRSIEEAHKQIEQFSADAHIHSISGPRAGFDGEISRIVFHAYPISETETSERHDPLVPEVPNGTSTITSRGPLREENHGSMNHQILSSILAKVAYGRTQVSASLPDAYMIGTCGSVALLLCMNLLMVCLYVQLRKQCYLTRSSNKISCFDVRDPAVRCSPCSEPFHTYRCIPSSLESMSTSVDETLTDLSRSTGPAILEPSATQTEHREGSDTARTAGLALVQNTAFCCASQAPPSRVETSENGAEQGTSNLLSQLFDRIDVPVSELALWGFTESQLEGVSSLYVRGLIYAMHLAVRAQTQSDCTQRALERDLFSLTEHFTTCLRELELRLKNFEKQSATHDMQEISKTNGKMCPQPESWPQRPTVATAISYERSPSRAESLQTVTFCTASTDRVRSDERVYNCTASIDPFELTSSH